MTKQGIVLAILLAMMVPLKAQSINAFVLAGTAASQVEGDELKGFNHWGLHGGVGAWIGFDEKDRWGMSIETDYTCRGIYNNRMSADSYYNISMNLHYVDIPVTMFFHDPFGGLRLGAGLVYSRLVSQPNGTIKYRPTFFYPDTTDMKFLKNDIAAALEARVDLWKGLQLSIRYQYSLIPVKKDWHFWMEDNVWSNNCYNSSLTLRVIWQFGYDDRPSQSKNNKNRNNPRR